MSEISLPTITTSWSLPDVHKVWPRLAPWGDLVKMKPGEASREQTEESANDQQFGLGPVTWRFGCQAKAPASHIKVLGFES